MVMSRLRQWARRGRRGARPRALLAWEYGSGHTHVVNLLAVARKLRADGIDCLATLHDGFTNPDFQELGIPTVQNFVWPHARRFSNHDGERPYGGFPDLLGNLGMAEPVAVEAVLRHYDGLFSLFDPDIVLCEQAYGAQLAARGRCPAIAFGFGQYLPPRMGRRLSPGDQQTSWSEDEVLVGLNAGLARAGRTPLDDLAQLFDVDAVLPFGPAAFDLNTPWRLEPALPVHVPGFSPGTRAGGGSEVFVYLHGFAIRRPNVIAALLTLERPIRAHVVDLNPDDRASLTAAGVAIEERPIPVPDLLQRTGCILHHGGVSLTAVALATGLPQVILSKQLDNRVAGEFVEREGLGVHRPLAQATAGWIIASVGRGFDDEALRCRAWERAPEFEAWFGPDPTEQVAAAALDCIKRSRRAGA
jgi:rhamnosyltransferase subunit B